MHKLSLFNGSKRRLSVLCLGAHSDDIEIGCAGTLLRLLDEGYEIEVTWVVLANNGDDERQKEATASAESLLGKASKSEIIVKNFKDGFMPYNGDDVKESFEELKHSVQPDIVFTHHRDDLHQDHRLVSELTWNTYRDHLILEYEILKYDGGLGSPNFFVPLGQDIYQKKVNILMENFKTQKKKQWFNQDALSALMCVRGVECNSESRYAEAFYCNKLVI